MYRFTLFLLGCLAALADNYTTWYALTSLPEGDYVPYEANPLAAFGMEHLGLLNFLWIEGTLSALIVLWLLWWPAKKSSIANLITKWGPRAVTLLILIQGAAAINNMVVIDLIQNAAP